MKAKILEAADYLCHRTCDWYINAKPFGHHLPDWGIPSGSVRLAAGCPGDCSVCRVEPRVPSNVTLGAE